MGSKFQKIVFILTLIGIPSLIFALQITKPIHTGVIKSIQTSNTKTKIKLENYSTELIIFETTPLNIKKGDTIEFQGKKEIYKNKEQIIVDKIMINNIPY